jgi:hypothetical protein
LIRTSTVLGTCAIRLLDLLRHRPDDVQVRPLDLDVDRGFEAEVQHIADDAAGLKGDSTPGSDALNFFRSSAM